MGHIEGDILDYGSGNMPYRLLFRNCNSFIGLDYEVTGKKFDFFNEDIVYYDGKIIPFDDERFDCVLCNQVLEHVEDLELALSEIHRVLRKDGVVLITLPMCFPLHMEPYDFRRFTKYGIERMLHDAGFHSINIVNSSSNRDTVRRLRTFGIPRVLKKVVAFHYNVQYLFDYCRKEAKEGSFTLDYLVECKK